MHHVLIVDDDETRRSLLRDVLSARGFRIDEVDDGAAALARAREARPDLVISGLLMPVMDGYSLLRRWKSDAKLRDTPFVIHSADLTDERDERLARALGADAVLAAPQEPDALLRQLDEVLERARRGALQTAQPPADDPQAIEHACHAILVSKLQDQARALRQANRRLTCSEAHYRRLFESNPQPMWVYDLETLRFLAVNEAAIAHYGYRREEFLAMTIADIRPPEEVPRLLANVRGPAPAYFGHGELWRHRRRDGSLFDVEIKRNTIDLDGRPARLVLAIDVTARLRAERALARINRLHMMLSQTNELLLRADNRVALFDGICRIAVEHGGFRFAWVGLVDADGAVHPVARAGDDMGYIDAVNARAEAADERGAGPAGRALRSGANVVVNDFLSDAAASPWHDAARRVGVGAVAALPIRKAGRVIGTINLYATETDFFNDHELAVLSDMALDVSSGLDLLAHDEERAHLLAELESSELRWRYALDGAGHGVWEWNVQTDRVFYSPQWKRMLGYDEADIGDAPSEWESRVHPDDFARAKAELGRHLAGAAPHYCSEHRLRGKDGQYRWILDQGKVMKRAADGQPLVVVGTHTDITERKRTEERLRDSEARFRAAFEQASVGMAYTSAPGGQWLLVNQCFCDMLGYTREELLACNFSAVTHPDDLPHDVELARRILRGEVDSYVREKRYLRKDGQPIWASVTATLVRRPDGTPDYFAGVIVDITERKRAALALATSEARFRAAFEQAAVGMAHTLPDGRRLMVNQRFADMLGYTREELLGSAVSGVTHPDDYARDLEFARRVIDGAADSYAREKRYLRKDGGIVWAAVSTTLVRKPDGTPDYFAGVVVDITERKQAEAELRKLSQAVEQSSEAIVITDAEGTIEYVNDSFTRVSGYARDEAIGRNPRILKSGKTPRATYEAMWAALRAGRPWSGELHNRRKDGVEYVEAASISPIRAPDGRITHYVAVKEDVTERRRIARELEQYRERLEEMVAARTAELEAARRQADAANAAKSAFVANMSHEIRTPMNGVLGMLEVLEQSQLTEQQADMVRTARDSGRTLLGIIDDILDFSKIEAGRLQIERVPMSVAAVVEALCESLAPTAEHKQVDLSVFVAPDIPARVRSDPLRLRQILFNLIGNAIKFSGGTAERSGRVAVRVTVAQRAPLVLAFAVIDNGIGIAAEHVERLFTPFSQAEVSTTRRFGGTGLGLAVCKRLAGLMGGQISVASTLGAGSAFTLTLPVDVPAEQPPREAPLLAGVECLVDETGELDVDALCAYLEHAGARVHRVAGARDGARLAATLAGPVVAIRRADSELPDAAPAPPLPSHARQLLITRGRRRNARITSANTVAVDGNALRRDALLAAVAIAAGRASPGRPPEPARIAPSPAASAQPQPILVAEDDDVNQQVILMQLELLGHSATVARNGAEALRRWRAGRYALLLTDLHMPEMDGYELTRAIRREEAQRGTGERLPIVALTANALRGEAERARALGMDDYLTKPLQLEQLRDALARWLARDAAPAAALDLAVLKKTIGDDPAQVPAFLAFFLTTARKQAGEMRAAADAGDAAKAGATAHKLKSSSRAVGALALGELCAELEQCGKAGELDALRARLPGFDAELARVQAQIDALAGAAMA